MRVAQYHHCSKRVGKLFFEVIEINRVFPVRIQEGIFENVPARVFDRMKKNIVDGRLQNYVVARVGNSLHRAGYRWNYARTETQPFFFYIQRVPALPPARKSFIPAFGHNLVTEYARFEFAFKRGQNFGRGLKIHIGDPHRQFALGNVPFEGIGSAPVYKFAEIVFHAASFKTITVLEGSTLSGSIISSPI